MAQGKSPRSTGCHSWGGPHTRLTSLEGGQGKALLHALGSHAMELCCPTLPSPAALCQLRGIAPIPVLEARGWLVAGVVAVGTEVVGEVLQCVHQLSIHVVEGHGQV